MAKKQVIVNETAAAASPARAAKPRVPRVKAAQHSKTVSSENVISQTNSENSHEAIAQIAYGYWEARGGQAGSDVEDWVLAEKEYRQRSATAR
jgi:hypothetical protein